MGFNIIGDIFNSTGYAIHTRNLAGALFKIAPTRLSVSLPPNWHTMVNDRELEMIKRKKEKEKEEINIIITNPLYWKLNTSGKRNWAYMIWEGDKIPRCFVEECCNPDIEYVLVSSNHTRTAIQNTIKEFNSVVQIYVSGKIKVIPHGVDLNLFYPTEKPNKCVFIANKGLRGIEDRGGIQYLLKAYLEEFADEEVELLIKINPAYGLINLQELIDKMVEKKAKYPKLTINDQLLKYEDLAKFYNKGTVFVSPTRAEAFNIPIMEAFACGLPCITTNFGGQTDYVNNENGWIIGGEMTEVKWDLMYEGINWLTPNYQELRKMLRWCFEHNEDVNKKGQKALETARQYTWDKSAEKIKELQGGLVDKTLAS